MDGKILIKTLRLRNFLSYGDTSEEIPLQPLNVLIGRNASGKSNLIEAISLLHATPKDFAKPLREGGGITEWLWQGQQTASEAEIEVVVVYPAGAQPLRYRISFTAVGQRVEITSESIETETPETAEASESFFYRFDQTARRVRDNDLSKRSGTTAGRPWSRSIDNFSQEQSILYHLKSSLHYPEITYLGREFGDIRLFREEYFGPYTLARGPQDAALPNDFLLGDGSNLALVLNDFEHRNQPKRRVLERLKEFYDEVEDFTTKVQGGTVQLFIHERGLSRPVPALRLSDGTLHYLYLLVILCHPTPPPLMCIEEPELGLHPDILPTIAELLKEASERTQLIVTTHSDALVSALSDTPESILVCERDSEGTHLQRLEREPLREWLEKYSLGELWRMGEIGGTRW
jgi:predicted ATPase